MHPDSVQGISQKRALSPPWCAGGQLITVALTGCQRQAVQETGHLQVWDQMTKEHGRQHNRAIQLLPNMGRKHLALTGLHRRHTKSEAGVMVCACVPSRQCMLLVTSRGQLHCQCMLKLAREGCSGNFILGGTCTFEASLHVFDRTNVRTPVSVSRLNWSTFCRHAQTRL